ncbi:MAG: hypothetical protein R3Y27_05410 [Clostridia bacterium]
MFNKIKEKITMKKMPIEKIDDSALNAYLSQNQCQRCHNHCNLDAIKCGGGVADRSAKVAEFKAQ